MCHLICTHSLYLLIYIYYFCRINKKLKKICQWFSGNWFNICMCTVKPVGYLCTVKKEEMSIYFAVTAPDCPMQLPQQSWGGFFDLKVDGISHLFHFYITWGVIRLWSRMEIGRKLERAPCFWSEIEVSRNASNRYERWPTPTKESMSRQLATSIPLPSCFYCLKNPFRVSIPSFADI